MVLVVGMVMAMGVELTMCSKKHTPPKVLILDMEDWCLPENNNRHDFTYGEGFGYGNGWGHGGGGGSGSGDQWGSGYGYGTGDGAGDGHGIE